jgi:HSP20 family protein
MVTLRKYEPFDPWTRDVERMFSRMLDLPNRVFGEEAALAGWQPRMDVKETDNALVVRMDLPGMDQKDIRVNVENNLLTVSGERRMEEEKKGETFHRVECYYGNFSRGFSLPQTVDAGKIDAKYRNGVLEIRLPKREESKPRQISIQVG